MFQDAALRVREEAGAFKSPILLANARHHDLIADQLSAVGVAPELVILEPMPKNTAPAIAALAVAVERDNPGEILIVSPADHAVADDTGFRETLLKGTPAAADGAIVTFGVKPTRPETGYGYVRGGEAINDDVMKVSAFVEKPDLATAESYLASGNYYWNAGIFMFRSDVMIEEMRRWRPDILEAAEKAVSQATRTQGALRLDPDAFAAAPEDSIDYAVMERTDKAAVAPASFGWSDIGSWSALWEIADRDASGNTSRGDDGALLIDSSNTLAVSDGPKIAAVGVKDLIIVATADGVLVAPRDRAQDVKKIVQGLKDDRLDELL